MKNILNKYLKNYKLLVSLWALFIFILISIPMGSVPKMPKFIDLIQPDKIVHIVIYAVFVFLLFKSFIQSGVNLSSTTIMFIVFIIGAIYSGTSELLQKYVFIYRTCSLYDFIADVIGCFIGLSYIKFSMKINFFREDSSSPF